MEFYELTPTKKSYSRDIKQLNYTTYHNFKWYFSFSNGINLLLKAKIMTTASLLGELGILSYFSYVKVYLIDLLSLPFVMANICRARQIELN